MILIGAFVFTVIVFGLYIFIRYPVLCDVQW